MSKRSSSAGSGASPGATSGPRFQLLDEPLIGVEDSTGAHLSVSLPELLARYSRGEQTEATALQAHQQHAFFAFLAQLAALALGRAGETSCEPRDAASWRALLVATAEADGAGEEAFALVVPDVSKAAFLQPALPGGSIAELKNTHTSPSEELDVLITSKNHDVKMDRMAAPSPEHWVFALITLQTMQGFLGAGNYGITRMNGGFASRPCVAFAPSMHTNDRFRRDVNRLLEARAALLADRPASARKKGSSLLGLVWCRPWDGASSLGMDELDPLFIEVCRRVRLVAGPDGLIVAHRGSSKAARIDGKALNGMTDDAWTPVSIKKTSSLTVPESGFTYDRVSDLFHGDWKHGAAGKLSDADGEEPLWLGQVLVRGQGKTGGYHERWVPIPSAARGWFLTEEGLATLGERAQAWVEMAGNARLKVLKPALLSLVQGGPDKLDYEDARVNPLLDAFDDEIDRRFFEQLFAHLAEDDLQARTHWHTWLRDRARDAFERAIDGVPMSAARRSRAIAMGERQMFFGRRRFLPDAVKQSAHEEASNEPTEVTS